MTMEIELKKDAVYIGAQLHAQRLRILKKIEEGELVIANLVRKAEAAGLAPERALKFTALLRGELQCPNCWVEQGVSANLVPKNAHGDRDVFACNICGHEFLYPA